MDLIINQMMKFQVMHITYGNRTVKLFTGTSVTKAYFTGTVNRNTFPLFTIVHMLFKVIVSFLGNTVFPDFRKLFPGFVYVVIGHFQCLHNILFIRTIKYRCFNLKAKSFGGKTKMNLQDLSDIHTGRYAQWVQHDIQRPAIRQERHIFNW